MSAASLRTAADVVAWTAGAPDRPLDIALELWDPVGTRIVAAGVRVTLHGRPAVPPTPSGRFVWYGRNLPWPARLEVDVGPQPFESIRGLDFVPLRPPSWPNSAPAERRVRVVLTPDSRYPPTAVGACGLRGVVGSVVPALAPRFVAKAGAVVAIEFRDATLNTWRSVPGFATATANARGEFALYSRIPPAERNRIRGDDGRLLARLAITHGGVTKHTPDPYLFAPDLPPGRIPDGIAVATWTVVDWDALAP